MPHQTFTNSSEPPHKRARTFDPIEASNMLFQQTKNALKQHTKQLKRKIPNLRRPRRECACCYESQHSTGFPKRKGVPIACEKCILDGTESVWFASSSSIQRQSEDRTTELRHRSAGVGSDGL
ncbi:hypothetical protein CERZMDRAFT_96869 [Cercospora zeae-maydis SCOH1-5]|uniref:Uncharacterized protein n=1 Tax=Cercospora zeae-maydis SCOH1-5 TaxID=717836 RepID=A0A6A6FIF1_9PEZI|nr:hypothetical protein CERZMDRAFT_96869 [Cercospora zeae-maydis SCOH1-5]